MPKPFIVESPSEDFVLTVGEKSYVLRYNFFAFRTYEQASGQDPFDAGFRVNVENFDTFLWAGLKQRCPGLTLEEVQSWITPASFKALLDYVDQAYSAVMPPAPPVAEPGLLPDPPSA